MSKTLEISRGFEGWFVTIIDPSLEDEQQHWSDVCLGMYSVVLLAEACEANVAGTRYLATCEKDEEDFIEVEFWGGNTALLSITSSYYDKAVTLKYVFNIRKRAIELRKLLKDTGE